MPKFFVTAKDKNGATHSMVIDAVDVDRAVVASQADGFFVINVQPLEDQQVTVNQPLQQTAAEHKYTHTGVKVEDIVVFARQLATMLDAGVPLLRSLAVIAQQAVSRRLGEALDAVKLDVEQGETFSKGLSKHPLIFNQFWVSLVEAGEASGTLPQILLKLTSYVEDDARFRGQIIGALIYPGVLGFICLAAVLFFALFIGPTFEKVFLDMGTELPGFTVVMLAIFKFIKTQFLLIIAFVVGTFFAIRFYIKTPAGRWQFEALLLSLPTFGEVFRLIVIERFTSQMAVLINSGVPILYSLEIAERLVDHSICAEIIKNIRESVREGKLLAQPMEDSGFFPPMAIQMVRVGEETGELGKMLNHVAVYNKQNIENFIKSFGTLIEPVMLVVMGAVIGAIVISMFLPIFDLSG